jgi:hypothetical protein
VAGEVNESAIVDDATASLAHDCRLHWVIEDLLAGGLVPLLADSGPFLWLFPEEGLDASRENDHAPSARSAASAPPSPTARPTTPARTGPATASPTRATPRGLPPTKLTSSGASACTTQLIGAASSRTLTSRRPPVRAPSTRCVRRRRPPTRHARREWPERGRTAMTDATACRRLKSMIPTRRL